MKQTFLITGLLIVALFLGYLHGARVTKNQHQQEVYLTFKPISDCFVEFRMNGEYMQWQISDFRLMQDWEKNRYRDCEAEVADILKPFLEKNGLEIREYEYENK